MLIVSYIHSSISLVLIKTYLRKFSFQISGRFGGQSGRKKSKSERLGGHLCGLQETGRSQRSDGVLEKEAVRESLCEFHFEIFVCFCLRLLCEKFHPTIESIGVICMPSTGTCNFSTSTNGTNTFFKKTYRIQLDSFQLILAYNLLYS